MIRIGMGQIEIRPATPVKTEILFYKRSNTLKPCAWTY